VLVSIGLGDQRELVSFPLRIVDVEVRGLVEGLDVVGSTEVWTLSMWRRPFGANKCGRDVRGVGVGPIADGPLVSGVLRGVVPLSGRMLTSTGHGDEI
jgi:hypothetical protein